MNYLIVGDTHFTDSPLDSYRWDIFKVLKGEASRHNVGEIVFLGDVVDRKDRHTAVLVNRLIDEFADLKFETKCEINVLAGNHDKPLTGPYYWQFLNRAGIRYIQEPYINDSLVYLPYVHDPVKEWNDIKTFNPRMKVIFMHQTVEGAIAENDYALSGTPNLLQHLPSDIPIFSGDVHRPQSIRNITYVGVPYPTRFSESWANRIILIKEDDFQHQQDVWIDGIKRSILDIEDSKVLNTLNYKEGDQIKIRYKLSNEKLVDWPEEEKRIREWEKERKTTIVSIEPLLVGEGLRQQTVETQQVELLPHEEILRLFCTQEKLSDSLSQFGSECLKESK